MRKKHSLPIIAILVGLVVTLITGLVDVTPQGLVGATWHGLPLPWLYVIVYPGSPWTIDWLNLAGDLVLWIAISFAIIFLVFRKRTNAHSAGQVITCLILLFALVVVQMSGPLAFGQNLTYYGDQNVEQWTSSLAGNIVQAYTKITVSGPVVIQVVSMYLQYSGSDGSQCLKFGVYQDNGNGSPAGQPLVASTQHAYCFHVAVTWGPAWQKWNLRPDDALVIPAAGDYWIATLASRTFGSVYHYAYSSSYDYTYGYADFFFAAPYSAGLPITFSSNTVWEGNAPYSFYVAAAPA